LPIPTCLRDVQSFLGFANFFRHFIQDYARKALSLLALLKHALQASKKEDACRVDSTPHQDTASVPLYPLSGDALAAFEALETAFMSAPLLQCFDEHKPLRIETDASQRALGGILTQPVETESVTH
jgi:hypothetical protein